MKSKAERHFLILPSRQPWCIFDHEPAMHPCSKDCQQPPRLYVWELYQQVKEGVLPLYSALVRRNWSAGSSSGVPRLSSVVSSDKSKWAQTIRKHTFTVRTTGHWSRLHSEAVEFPSSEIFKTPPDTVLTNLLWMTLLDQGRGWTRWPLEVPSKLSYFMILWCMTLDSQIADTESLGKPYWASQRKAEGYDCAKDLLTYVNFSSGKLWKVGIVKSRLLNSSFWRWKQNVHEFLHNLHRELSLWYESCIMLIWGIMFSLNHPDSIDISPFLIWEEEGSQ